MEKIPLQKLKILGARQLARLTGKVHDRATWAAVWGDTPAYDKDRWRTRGEEFAKKNFDYNDALAFLAASGRGSARDMADGSIPASDLDFIATDMRRLPRKGALRGLHIGNFIGLSLAYVTNQARQLDPFSVVLSIDPGIPHRGIDAPHDLVTGVMNRYRLEGNWLPVSAYSLERTSALDILNDPKAATPHASYFGFSATHALRNLKQIGARFDFVLIDGNHNAGYLKREIDMITQLVRPGGRIYLDDVEAEAWPGVYRVFQELENARFEQIGHQNRIGIIRRKPLKKNANTPKMKARRAVRRKNNQTATG